MGSSTEKEHLLLCIVHSRICKIHVCINDYKQSLSSYVSEIQTQVFSFPSIEEKVPQSYCGLDMLFCHRDETCWD